MSKQKMTIASINSEFSQVWLLKRWIADPVIPVKVYLQEWTKNWEIMSRGGPSSKELQQLTGKTQICERMDSLQLERALMPLPGYSEWDRRSQPLKGLLGNRVIRTRRGTSALQDSEADVAGEAEAGEGQDPMEKDLYIQPSGGNDDIATSPADALSAEEASLVEYFVDYVFEVFTAKFQTRGHADQVDSSTAGLGRGQGEEPSKKRKGRGNDDQDNRPGDERYDGTPPSDPSSGPPPLSEKEAPKFGCQVLKGNPRDPTISQNCLRGWCQINRLKNDHLSRHHLISLDTISHEEVKRVCGKSNPTNVERWKAIFRILFPGLPIPSPYINSSDAYGPKPAPISPNILDSNEAVLGGTALRHDSPNELMNIPEELIKSLKSTVMSRAHAAFEQNRLNQKFDEEERQLEQEFKQRREELRQRRRQEMESFTSQMVEGALREHQIIGSFPFVGLPMPQVGMQPLFSPSNRPVTGPASGAPPDASIDTTTQESPSVTPARTRSRGLYTGPLTAERMRNATCQAHRFSSNRNGSASTPITQVTGDTICTSQRPPSSATLSSPPYTNAPNSSFTWPKHNKSSSSSLASPLAPCDDNGH